MSDDLNKKSNMQKMHISNSDNPFILKSSKIVYENRWIKIHEDRIIHPENGDGIYAYLESRDSVCVVPMNEKGEIFLIYTFNYPRKNWRWELPGGGGENRENFAESSRRELAEETGIVAKKWDFVDRTQVLNGLASEQMNTMLARDLTFGEKIKSDDAALIRDGKFFTLEQIHEMALNDEIKDGQTLTALYLAELFLKKEEK